MIAGPNGTGKSTFTQNRSKPGKILHNVPVVDPDAIAQRIAPKSVSVSDRSVQMNAAKEALRAINDHIKYKESFVWETTLASGKVDQKLKSASENGSKTQLHFIGLDNWQQSRARVNRRKEKGGHDIPTEDIKRRFERILTNLAKNIKVADKTFLYKNEGESHVLIGSTSKQVLLLKKDAPNWCHQLTRQIEIPFKVKIINDFRPSL